MLDDIAGTYGSRLFVAAGGVAVALLVLVAVLWLVRNRAPSPFVRGGKGRQQRLQVLDAAAIDARRRIVLIRRDGVEHLVMIGGPTDIVIETGIGDASKASAAAPAIAVSTPLDAITAGEAARIQSQLQAPREPPSVTSRRPEPTVQLSPPPVQAAIEAPVAASSERRPQPEQQPTVAVAEPVAAVPPAERPQPPRQTTETKPAERIDPVVFERKEEIAAADVLDAARHRVLAQQPEQAPEPAITSSPVPAASAPAAPILLQDAYSETYDVLPPHVKPPKEMGSDFESILEAEMSNTLTAERVVPPANPPLPVASKPETVTPARPGDADISSVSGGDAALQKEVARIFGEISVTRDK